MPQTGMETEKTPKEMADPADREAAVARQALLSDSELPASSERRTEYSLASGTLSIYSHPAENMEEPFGHSWIAFKSDRTGKTTTYATYLPEGLHVNEEVGYLKQPGRLSIMAARSRHIDNRSERRLMDLIGKYRSAGSEAWTFSWPCSSFAADAWLAGTGEVLNPNMFSVILSNPATLKHKIIRANGGRQFETDRHR
jgi:hypothetical protein